MLSRLKWLFWLGVQLTLVMANVEKSIFVAPESMAIPNVSPGLEELCLEELSPRAPKIQKLLPVSFPDDVKPLGQQSWYLVKDLEPGSRYEVRICWSSSQPTAFDINLFGLKHTLYESKVIQELAAYADSKQVPSCRKQSTQDVSATGKDVSIMFLSIDASSEFYSSNQTLMHNPPDVLIEISFQTNPFPKFREEVQIDPRLSNATIPYNLSISTSSLYFHDMFRFGASPSLDKSHSNDDGKEDRPMDCLTKSSPSSFIWTQTAAARSRSDYIYTQNDGNTMLRELPLQNMIDIEISCGQLERLAVRGFLTGKAIVRGNLSYIKTGATLDLNFKEFPIASEILRLLSRISNADYMHFILTPQKQNVDEVLIGFDIEAAKPITIEFAQLVVDSLRAWDLRWKAECFSKLAELATSKYPGLEFPPLIDVLPEPLSNALVFSVLDNYVFPNNLRFYLAIWRQLEAIGVVRSVQCEPILEQMRKIGMIKTVKS